MSGGYSDFSKNSLQSTADIFNGSVWDTQSTTNLPNSTWGHCIVKINSSTILSISGAQQKKYVAKNDYYPYYNVKNTYFFNAKINKWTPGPTLNLARTLLSCGLLMWNNPESNQLQGIVVASGGSDNGKYLTSIELLYLNEEDVYKGDWVMGPALPGAVIFSTMVEYKHSVILIGGVDGRHLYQLSSPSGPWTQMRQALKYNTRKQVAFLVPDQIVSCHHKGNFNSW